MTLVLKPEIEALIRKQIATGAYASAEEVIERALASLDAQLDWIADNREQVAEMIQKGWDEAQRGELIDEHSLREELRSRKDRWHAEHQTA